MNIPKEPKIHINGVELTESQAVTVRVAVTQYLVEMGEPFALGDDEHGEKMRSLYQKQASEVLRVMVRT